MIDALDAAMELKDVWDPERTFLRRYLFGFHKRESNFLVIETIAIDLVNDYNNYIRCVDGFVPGYNQID